MPEGVGYPAPQMAQPQQGSSLDQILMMLFGMQPQQPPQDGLDMHMRRMQGGGQGESEEEAFKRLQREQGAAKGALGSLGR